jgi:hypothetical protein
MYGTVAAWQRCETTVKHRCDIKVTGVDILMNMGKKQCHKRRMFSNVKVGSTAAVS